MDADLQISQLTRALAAGEDVWVVHYSCESFYEVLDHPPAISAIGVSRVPPGEDRTFSVIDRAGDDSERHAFEAFYLWLRGRPDAHIVHWNMNNSDYGWDALAKRYAFITPDAAAAPSHPQERLYDLDELIKFRHGSDYARKPKLSTLIATNGISARYSMTGEEQAGAYGRGDHAALARSTADRVRAIAEIGVKFVEGSLVTERSGPAVRWAGALLDSISVVLAIASRLRDASDELGRRYGDRAGLELNDEYDYQDALRGMLRLFFDDVRAEDYVPEYAGGASRVDFLLPAVGLGVEVKVARTTMTTADLGAQLLVDAARYKAHPGVRHLVCLVFDPERLVENPTGLEGDLSQPTNDLPVTVFVAR